MTQVGGYYIPEDGTITTLLIYVQLTDDDYVDNHLYLALHSGEWSYSSFKEEE